MTNLLSIKEAHKLAGISRSTMLRQVKRGKVSATLNPETEAYEIDPAELARVYPHSVNTSKPESENQGDSGSYDDEYVELLQQTVRDQKEQLEDMRQSRERLETIIQQQSESIADSQQRLLTHDDQAQNTQGRAVPPPQPQISREPNQGGFIAAMKKRFTGSVAGSDDLPLAPQ